jgi:hypothetical protein
MEKLRSPKVCAALVMIAWLATLVSSWGMEAAGRNAIAREGSRRTKALKMAGRMVVLQDIGCFPSDIKSKGVQLEMASCAEAALSYLGRKLHAPVRPGSLAGRRSACIQRGVAAQVRADYVFIPAYSLLILALFLFIGSMRTEPAWFWVLLVAGLLLAAIMAFGDVRENLQLEGIINAAGQDPPGEHLNEAPLVPLQHYAFLKMSALALSAVLLSIFWTRRPLRVVVWLLRLSGFTAAVLFGAGMAMSRSDWLEGAISAAWKVAPWQLASWGMEAFVAFCLFGLLVAVAVAIHPESLERGTRP